MTKMSENQNKPKIIFEELDNIPPAQHRNEIYDQIMQKALEIQKDTLSVQIEGKTAGTIHPAIQSRATEYNQNPDRQWDLLVAQRKEKVIIKRLTKGTVQKKQ